MDRNGMPYTITEDEKEESQQKDERHSDMEMVDEMYDNMHSFD